MVKKKLIIGRIELADFPSLKLKKIKVKVDTGAYTSSIHCHDIRIVKKNNVRMLKFFLLDPDHPEYYRKAIYAKKFEQKIIKSSNGETEKRYIIPANIKLNEYLYKIELSLTNRGEMKYPVLLGRRFLMGKFLVDVSLYNVFSRN